MFQQNRKKSFQIFFSGKKCHSRWDMGSFSQSDVMGSGTPTLSLPRSLVALACPRFAPVQDQGASAGRQRR